MRKLFCNLLLWKALISCTSAFAVADMSGEWLDHLSFGDDPNLTPIDTTLFLNQRGNLLCGAWVSRVLPNGYQAEGHVVGEVSGMRGEIIMSDNLISEDGTNMEDYLPSKADTRQHLSMNGSELYSKYTGLGLNKKIKTITVIYKKQPNPATISEGRWDLCKKFPLTHQSSGTPR